MTIKSMIIMLFLVAIPSTGYAGDLVAIAHGAVDASELSGENLRNAYLGRLTHWKNGEKVQAAFQVGEGNQSLRLFKSVLRMLPRRFKQHWSELELSGTAILPERLKATPAEFARMISQTPGAVGIVDADQLATFGDLKLTKHVLK